jgi:hypothetical protein
LAVRGVAELLSRSVVRGPLVARDEVALSALPDPLVAQLAPEQAAESDVRAGPVRAFEEPGSVVPVVERRVIVPVLSAAVSGAARLGSVRAFEERKAGVQSAE